MSAIFSADGGVEEGERRCHLLEKQPRHFESSRAKLVVALLILAMFWDERTAEARVEHQRSIWNAFVVPAAPPFASRTLNFNPCGGYVPANPSSSENGVYLSDVTLSFLPVLAQHFSTQFEMGVEIGEAFTFWNMYF